MKEIQKHKISEIEIDPTDMEGAFVAADVVDTNTGEILLEANSELTAEKLSKLMDAGVAELHVFFPERDDVGTVISATLRRDSVKTPQEALIEIYRKLRPGDPPTLDTATSLFHGMFFDPRKYDFSRVGRLKFNIKLFESEDATSSTTARWSRMISTEPSATCSSCARTSVRWTISITWATAACARLANCSRTSSASAWCAWNAPSRKR